MRSSSRNDRQSVKYGNLSCDYIGLHCDCEDKNDHSTIQFFAAINEGRRAVIDYY